MKFLCPTKKGDGGLRVVTGDFFVCSFLKGFLVGNSACIELLTDRGNPTPNFIFRLNGINLRWRGGSGGFGSPPPKNCFPPFAFAPPSIEC